MLESPEVAALVLIQLQNKIILKHNCLIHFNNNNNNNNNNNKNNNNNNDSMAN